jgi:hypothetical protein
MNQQTKALLSWFEDNMGEEKFLLESNKYPDGEWVSYLELPEYKALREAVDGPQTFQDLMNLVPGSEVLEDNDGQLVIYTGKRLDKNDTIVDFE